MSRSYLFHKKTTQIPSVLSGRKMVNKALDGMYALSESVNRRALNAYAKLLEPYGYSILNYRDYLLECGPLLYETPYGISRLFLG